MNHPKLSIIIPCYNCSKTLKQAFDSCSDQQIVDDFEIVMVDDASTDHTRELMKKLAEGKSNVKNFFHEKNRGGGATRNTAVAKSSSEIIFCLDSDDILPKETVGKMLKYMQEKECDGVGIERSIKFKGNDVNNVAFTNEFGYVGQKIPFENLIEKPGSPYCSLYSTFMFTKKAFRIAGGYAENHGFDTQSFAWRFLANGLTAYTCPGATYLHRISFNRSYYIREYESGKVNHNWFKVFEEFLYLFNEQIQNEILNFNLNTTQNFISDLILKKDDLFKTNYRSFIENDSSAKFERKAESAKDITAGDRYWLGVRKLNSDDYSKAFEIFEGLRVAGMDNEHVHYYLKLAADKVGKKSTYINEDRINALLNYKKQGSKVNILVRVSRKIYIVSRKKTRALLFEIKSRAKDPFKILAFFGLKMKKKLKIDFERNSIKSTRKIDIIMPTMSVDIEMLNEVIKSFKKLNHEVNKIYRISANKPEIIDFCNKNGIIFVDERKLMGYGKEVIDYKFGDDDRSGWIYQQLLKLSGDKITEMDDYFILDSDTIVVSPFSLIENNKFIFYQNEEWHDAYFKSFQKLFGYKARNKLSFTSHMMIFNRRMLALMKQELEKKYSKPWDKVYLSMVDKSDQSCISDYDTYGNWVLCNHPDRVIERPLYNIGLNRGHLKEVLNNIDKYAEKYKTVSFHHYIK